MEYIDREEGKSGFSEDICSMLVPNGQVFSHLVPNLVAISHPRSPFIKTAAVPHKK
jgi:hypothetical protein